MDGLQVLALDEIVESLAFGVCSCSSE